MSFSRKSKKEDASPSDEVLEEVNNHIKEAFEVLRRETKKVRMEKEGLDEAAKKLEHVHFSSMLKLNVGGHLFSTSLSTLNKDPGMFWNVYLYCQCHSVVIRSKNLAIKGPQDEIFSIEVSSFTRHNKSVQNDPISWGCHKSINVMLNWWFASNQKRSDFKSLLRLDWFSLWTESLSERVI